MDSMSGIEKAAGSIGTPPKTTNLKRDLRQKHNRSPNDQTLHDLNLKKTESGGAFPTKVQTLGLDHLLFGHESFG